MMSTVQYRKRGNAQRDGCPPPICRMPNVCGNMRQFGYHGNRGRLGSCLNDIIILPDPENAHFGTTIWHLSPTCRPSHSQFCVQIPRFLSRLLTSLVQRVNISVMRYCFKIAKISSHYRMLVRNADALSEKNRQKCFSCTFF